VATRSKLKKHIGWKRRQTSRREEVLSAEPVVGTAGEMPLMVAATHLGRSSHGMPGELRAQELSLSAESSGDVQTSIAPVAQTSLAPALVPDALGYESRSYGSFLEVAAADPDWKAALERARSAQFIPESAKAASGFGSELFFLGAGALALASFTRSGFSKDSTLAPKVKTITVADDYLINSTVKVDLNGDGIAETVAVYSGTPGKYLVTVQGVQTLGVISAQGGYSLIKGEVVENKIDLLTPAGWILVNPITTLVGTLVAKGFDTASAESAVERALGLSSLGLNLGEFDPFDAANKSTAQALSVQKAALGVVKLVATLEASGVDETAIWSAVANEARVNSSGDLLKAAGLNRVFSAISTAVPGVDLGVAKNQVLVVLVQIDAAASLDELPRAPTRCRRLC